MRRLLVMGGRNLLCMFLIAVLVGAWGVMLYKYRDQEKIRKDNLQLLEQQYQEQCEAERQEKLEQEQLQEQLRLNDSFIRSWQMDLM